MIPGGGSQDVIRLRGVTKQFRRYGMLKGMRTLKGTVMHRIRRRMQRIHSPGPGSLVVLDGVDLDVARGTTLAILGRNGSGKSTLLKLVSGIYRPDVGVVMTRGRIAALLELGTGFHPDFSGRENVWINGTLLGLDRKQIAQRFDSIIDFAELEEFIDAPVRTYSSGMFVRLAFSIAIHVEPDILLVDEVLAVGDEGFRKKCMAKVGELQAAGTTIVLVTHELPLVERLATRAVVLEHGHLYEGRTPAESIAHYLTGQAGPAGPFELRELRLLGPAGVALERGGPFELATRLRVLADVATPVLMFECNASNGTVAFAANTKDHGCKLGPWKSGDERELVVRGRAWLQPDLYALRIYAATAERGPFAFVGGADLRVAGRRSALGPCDLEAELTVSGG